MNVGQTFQSTVTRPYTTDGERRIHTRVTEWEVTECDGEFLAAAAVGIVSEIDRPDFAGYPTELTMLVSSYQRRIATGEIVEV
jgi:hypothetical protein